MKLPSVIMPVAFRTIPNALLLLVLLVNLTIPALGDDGRKNLEARAQQLTNEGRALEDKQQFKEAEGKYTAAEAIISTKDGKSGLERIQNAESKKFHDLLAEAHGLFDAGKPADAARSLEQAKSLAPQDRLFTTILPSAIKSPATGRKPFRRWIKPYRSSPRTIRIALNWSRSAAR